MGVEILMRESMHVLSVFAGLKAYMKKEGDFGLEAIDLILGTEGLFKTFTEILMTTGRGRHRERHREKDDGDFDFHREINGNHLGRDRIQL